MVFRFGLASVVAHSSPGSGSGDLSHIGGEASKDRARISPFVAVNPRAGMGQYDVAKAGILSMTRTLGAIDLVKA